MRKKLMDSLRRSFRPEFINRLDSVIVFRALNRDDIRQIVALEIEKVSERLQEHDLMLVPTEAALDFLAQKSFDPEMGARPVRRLIQQEVEEQLSDALLSNQFKAGDTIVIDVDTILTENQELERRVVLKQQKDESEAETMEPLSM
jgi:ATP-dependent Clp protease ATP-binding subunit ClpC